MDIQNNTVSAEKQVQKSRYTEIFDNGGKLNVLFIGNSITRHEPKPEIGWNHDWGMAATKRENDYVHIAVRLLEKKYGKVNYCIANCGAWELRYFDDGLICEWERAKNFPADVVVIRLGEIIAQAKDKLSLEPVAPHYTKMLKYFVNSPNVKVIITGLFWQQETIEKAIEQVAREQDCVFVRLSDLGEDESNMAIGEFAHRGVAMHPNDRGMKKIAERIVAAL